MDIAAELIGIKPYQTKLLAFAVSSFYCGVAGAMLVFLYLGNAESESFSINQSFLVLFMIIIGGLGSLLGSFFGATLIYGLPIVMRMTKESFGIGVTSATLEQINFITLGTLIILFLIAEPSGLARLWQIGKQKLRVWPFPY
jgi:branched-chain amino acid transport system permease protein